MDILIVGIHTRPAVFSAKELGYRVYSVDYFGDIDLKEKADFSRSIVDQQPFRSMGRISENYSDEKLIELAKDIDSDLTVLTSTLKFNNRKVIGTPPKRMKKIKDKAYQLKKVQKTGVQIPKSFIIHSKEEIIEIAKDHGLPLILKPVRGDSGRNIVIIKSFEDVPEIEGKFVLQEYIKGKPISVSTLSTKRESMALSTSLQILGSKLLNQRGLGYCGNVVPYPCDKEVLEVAESISKIFKVIGWNGIDFVMGKELVFMEINPRFQGTFDCIEVAYGINLLGAHIKACEGELIDKPVARNYAVRMTLFARERSLVTGDLRGVSYDIPCKDVIIEEGEPITTVITSSKSKNEAITQAKERVKFIYGNFIKGFNQ